MAVIRTTSMEYSAEELEGGKEFHLIRVLDYRDVAVFVLENIRRINAATLIFFMACFVSFGWLLSFTVRFLGSVPLPWYRVIYFAFAGLVVIPLLLVPIHELLHAAIYYLSGARNIKFGTDMSQFIFYVTAHRQVVGWRTFLPVALAPFLGVSLLLVLPVIFWDHPLCWSAMLALFAHTTMCVGDFAMLSFFLEKGKNRLFTFDDTEARQAYFYLINPEEE